MRSEFYYQIIRPDGELTPLTAPDFDTAADEFLELCEDMLIQEKKSGKPNWASRLAGTTFTIKIRNLDSREEELRCLTLSPRTEDMTKTFFKGPQATPEELTDR